MRILLAALFVLVAWPAAAQVPAPLEFEVRAKLSLVQLKLKDEGRTMDLGRAVDGKAMVIVRNTSDHEVTFEDLEAANFAFLNAASGTAWPMVHPCTVVGACKPDGPVGRKIVTLAPGAEHTVEIEEFACSGSYWKAPPPGEYDLVYRVRVVAANSPAPEWCPTETDDLQPRKTTEAAREVLRGKAFWQGSLSSKPQRVHFTKVRTKFL